MKNNIILSYIICDKCEQPMKLVKNKMKKDKIIWRWQKKGENKHQTKIIIRNNNIS